MNTINAYTSSVSYLKSANSAYKSHETNMIKQDTVGMEKNIKNNINSDIEDTATISDDAMELYNKNKEEKIPVLVTTIKKSNSDGTTSETTVVGNSASAKETETTEIKPNDSEENKTDTSQIKPKSKDPSAKEKELTKEEERVVQKLKERDTEVKAHEQAHLAAAGGLNASSPNYTYQTGPDGNQYAIGGEVSISFSKSQDPDENIRKAEQMKAAALAPADPSGQDRAVAQNADAIINSEEQKKQTQKDELLDTDNQAQPQEKKETNSDKLTPPAIKQNESETSESVDALALEKLETLVAETTPLQNMIA